MGKAEQVAKKAAEEEKKALEAARTEAAKEAQEWEDGAKKPNAKKADEEAKKSAKAERKAAADEELEAELADKPKKVTGNKANNPPPKKTQAEIADGLAAEKEAAEKAAEKDKHGVVNDYMGKLEENKNSLDAIDASSIDDALAALEASNDQSVDKVKLRAAFEAYQELELPRVKEEKPGLKLSQYKEMVWKAWQKSPQNPLRQRA